LLYPASIVLCDEILSGFNYRTFFYSGDAFQARAAPGSLCLVVFGELRPIYSFLG
jgi:hypothetical protein